jgi:eukaryotic-like serine/threonine-protein kinase
VNDTLLEFGGAAGATPGPVERRRVCAACGARFSGDARFCPFDGEALSEATAAAAPADSLIGTVIDKRYRVLRTLGEGGMGTVYEVEHVTLERRFAIKALRRDLGRHEDLSARFIQEAKAAAAISHPNVVQIADFGHLPTGEAYFVMELLGGSSLSAIIREHGPLPPQRVVDILKQVSHALAAAHEAGVIHRDLKPDNIQVCESAGDRDMVKVLDFGLARVAGASRLTRAGVVFGTPHYMSPEQASGDPIDHRSDIYALGIVMYEMLTGRVPFEADTFMGVLSKHLYMLPTPFGEVLGDTAHLGVLEDITVRCLQKKPEHRYASMLDLLADLERALGPGAAASALPVRSQAPSRLPSFHDEIVATVPGRAESRRSQRWVVTALFTVVLVGVGALALWLRSRPTATESQRSVDLVESAGAAASGGAAAPPPASAAVTASAPADEPPPAPTPTRRGTRAASARPAATAPGAPKRSPQKPTRIGGGEIVNPWEN